MTPWLFLLSSPEQPGGEPLPELLARAGHPVTVVVTDDFVVDAVVGGRAAELTGCGIEVLYDDAALRRRGLRDRVGAAARRSHDDVAALLLDERTKVVWR
ncbi:hypothetical protein [Myceligenerans crystallogenes]|uniref:DsrE/DsrF-like family protein n=1 Tax=Myceligenerans crystallogenes TaxID=316335 RepID=A0ABN2NH53_9MICO